MANDRDELLDVPIASPHTPEEDAAENKKKAGREALIVGVVLFLIFVVLLPQFIDYGQVIDSMRSLTIGQVVLLSILGLGFTWFSAGVLYRERVADRIGQVAQRWYNGLAGGRWKFPEAEGLGGKLVDFRGGVIGTVRSRWFPATVVTLTAQAIFFIALVLSMRFVGVTAEQASVAVIFDAYAIWLLLSMIPSFPGGWASWSWPTWGSSSGTRRTADWPMPSRRGRLCTASSPGCSQ